MHRSIIFKVTEQFNERLTEACETLGVSRSVFIRDAILSKCERMDQRSRQPMDSYVITITATNYVGQVYWLATYVCTTFDRYFISEFLGSRKRVAQMFGSDVAKEGNFAANYIVHVGPRTKNLNSAVQLADHIKANYADRQFNWGKEWLTSYGDREELDLEVDAWLDECIFRKFTYNDLVEADEFDW